MFQFLAPRGTEWDTPVIGEAFSTPSIPGPDVYNLRARRTGKTSFPLPERRPRARFPTPESQLPGAMVSKIEDWDLDLGMWNLEFSERQALGSNNWAVAGALTTDGHALIANDMHLLIRVPNTWYRAS